MLERERRGSEIYIYNPEKQTPRKLYIEYTRKPSTRQIDFLCS